MFGQRSDSPSLTSSRIASTLFPKTLLSKVVQILFSVLGWVS
jgi:hypothetical protein